MSSVSGKKLLIIAIACGVLAALLVSWLSFAGALVETMKGRPRVA